MADESIETDEPYSATGDVTHNGDELNASSKTDEVDDPVSYSKIYYIFNWSKRKYFDQFLLCLFDELL